ncbi:metacaspase CasA [Histoplasma ohiense]|nr:metacaspase CasA [Histoplasma ohiense (nom. inval.)]
MVVTLHLNSNTPLRHMERRRPNNTPRRVTEDIHHKAPLPKTHMDIPLTHRLLSHLTMADIMLHLISNLCTVLHILHIQASLRVLQAVPQCIAVAQVPLLPHTLPIRTRTTMALPATVQVITYPHHPRHSLSSSAMALPQGYSFQYSNCTGKRKALLIGINYFGQRGQLRGCINDVKNMSTYLNQNFGYAREDMVILTDDQQNPMSQPTKANILRAMHWLVKDARPNDSLFFHYSGHGGQTKDLDGDEEDGNDEVIYPVDFRSAGHIVDDEMHRIMVKSLLPGVRLTAIFDSCHSGSALDLPYIYSTQGILKEPNLAKEAGQGLLSVVSAYARGDVSGMLSTVGGLIKKATSGDASHSKARQTKTSPADVIMWSGSKDNQTSQDATIAGEATGAMSWAFITALKKNPQQSYVQLLRSIRDELATKYSQKPQLSCSHPLNTDLLYVM